MNRTKLAESLAKQIESGDRNLARIEAYGLIDELREIRKIVSHKRKRLLSTLRRVKRCWKCRGTGDSDPSTMIWRCDKCNSTGRLA